MYYPFFRGKQYELITIRENAQLLKDSGFVPIIEPVKESLNGLVRTLTEVEKVGGQSVVIVNPICGDYSDDSAAIQARLDEKLRGFSNFSVGVLLNADTNLDAIRDLCARQGDRRITLVHCGFNDGGGLSKRLAECSSIERHVFLEDACGKLYRRHFPPSTPPRVLIRDGFRRRPNREHPPLEPFSDLHVTFRDEENMDGFGDFLVVGDDYSETGGPAYAVAIHLTFIDHEKDDAMFIRHFVSDRTDTPTDPAGKFGEALKKLATEVNRPGSGIARTKAVEEFLALHQEGHFPGLGYVKKLSMQHHLETLSRFLKPR
jgi:hypothetical protein